MYKPGWPYFWAFYLVGFFVCRAVSPNTSVRAQSNREGIDEGNSDVTFAVGYETEEFPVRIKQIYLGDRLVTPDTPTHVSGAWLGNVRITVQNVSPKEIIAGTVTLSFPETGTGAPEHPILTSGANLGRVPLTAFRHKDGTQAAIPDAFTEKPEVHVPPGSTMEFDIGMAQGAVDQKEAYREARNITKIEIKTATFYFADGSKWTGASYQIPVDPPLLWKRVTPEAFSRNQGTGAL